MIEVTSRSNSKVSIQIHGLLLSLRSLISHKTGGINLPQLQILIQILEIPWQNSLLLQWRNFLSFSFSHKLAFKQVNSEGWESEIRN
jgi:hypothetical protein